MSPIGTATEALSSVETTEHHQRHLKLVESVASLIVATQYEPDYFNSLSGSDQIPFGD